MDDTGADKPIRGNEMRRVVMHVNFNDSQRLNYVLNNVENIRDHYHDKSQGVEIRIVCHGPGLHLLRIDTSPVKDRLLQISENLKEVGLYACANTIERMERAEGKRPELVPPAKTVAAGLPEIIELQRQGWTYLKP